MSHHLTQIQDLPIKVNSLSEAREFFHDPESGSSSGATHVPIQPLTIPSPRGMPSSDSGLPHDTRNVMGTSGNVFESLLAREGPLSALFENSRNLESSSRGLRPDITGNTMVDESHRIRQYLYHASKGGLEFLIILVETTLTMV